jgi:hypothetical protein
MERQKNGVVLYCAMFSSNRRKLHCFRIYDSELNNIVVKEEDDDAVSLPSQNTEVDTEGQTHYCSGSMIHVAGGGNHGLDNGDAIGIDVFAILAR